MTNESVYFLMVTPDAGISSWLKDAGMEQTENRYMADFAVFPGGEDVCPELYGEKKIEGTYSNFLRDRREVAAYHDLPLWMPKIGICRGSQFLNVMCGGKLWQDVNNHTRTHVARCELTEEDYMVTSTHHQMMIPAHDALLLLKAAEATEFKNDQGSFTYRNPRLTDVEALWYENERVLCFQPHPEYGLKSCDDLFWSYYGEFIAPLIMNESQYDIPF